ncbi:hypothetical protein [Microvirga makkahensis]|uniref:YubB ferredoxin-like domain-containing protein n=1 Tax=Microvirga makkahensis TaxID=1128670 RepID=A0A7X3MNR5_9HYPH|nr:hypothetical protein [Microvirga makkahensis]MXQ10456.1 hypothetical protein [Microvirga makkahensis]
MSNHVGSILTMSGSAHEIARFQASCFSTDPDRPGEVCLDFERITPSPSIISSIEALSFTEWAEAKLLLQRAGIDVSQRTLSPRFSNIEQLELMTPRELRDILLLQKRDGLNPSCLEAALQILECVRATGCYSPADWAMRNWGARGNAIYTEIAAEWPEDLEVNFDTEWSAPLPIFRKLGLMFPELEMQIASLDPNADWALEGSVKGPASKFWNADFASVYELVYGQPMCEADEDEFEDGDEE